MYNLIENLKRQAEYLMGVDCRPSANLMNQAVAEIERLKKLYDDPQWDATEAAHPAWWRGEKAGAKGFAKIIDDVLLGRNKCTGKMEGSLEHIRNSVFILKQERDNLQYQLGVMEAAYKSCFNDGQAKEIEKQDEQIKKLEKEQVKLILEVHNALEQRKADWQRIHDLEIIVESLKTNN